MGLTRDKQVLMVGWQPPERQAIIQLLTQLEMQVTEVASVQAAVLWLEENRCDLLLLDALSDVHPWTVLGEINEVVDISRLPTVVFMLRPTVVPMSNVHTLVMPVVEDHVKHLLHEIFD